MYCSCLMSVNVVINVMTWTRVNPTSVHYVTFVQFNMHSLSLSLSVPYHRSCSCFKLLLFSPLLIVFCVCGHHRKPHEQMWNYYCSYSPFAPLIDFWQNSCPKFVQELIKIRKKILKIYKLLPHISLWRILSGLQENYESSKGSNCHNFFVLTVLFFILLLMFT